MTTPASLPFTGDDLADRLLAEEPLALFAQICPTCPRLTKEQIKQLDAARRFGRGYFFARQGEYALYDMRLHTGQPGAPMPPWIAIETASPLGFVEGSIFPAGFGHLLGGYAAGYYGYMWSQVIAKDLFSEFRTAGLMDPATAGRYRRAVLEPGGSRPAAELVRDFLGRESAFDAYRAWLEAG